MPLYHVMQLQVSNLINYKATKLMNHWTHLHITRWQNMYSQIYFLLWIC